MKLRSGDSNSGSTLARLPFSGAAYTLPSTDAFTDLPNHNITYRSDGIQSGPRTLQSRSIALPRVAHLPSTLSLLIFLHQLLNSCKRMLSRFLFSNWCFRRFERVGLEWVYFLECVQFDWSWCNGWSWQSGSRCDWFDWCFNGALSRFSRRRSFSRL